MLSGRSEATVGVLGPLELEQRQAGITETPPLPPHLTFIAFQLLTPCLLAQFSWQNMALVSLVSVQASLALMDSLWVPNPKS